MKTIAILHGQNETGTVNYPAEPFPASALKIVSDGQHYIIYEEGDVLPEQPAIIPNPNDAILAQIVALEETQTLRRMRESLSDPTWINNLNVEISDLREKLV